MSGCLKVPAQSAGQGMTKSAVFTGALALFVSTIQISDARAGAAARGLSVAFQWITHHQRCEG